MLSSHCAVTVAAFCSGALFVAHLDGDYFNVMGLPLCRLGQLLNELGVELL